SAVRRRCCAIRRRSAVRCRGSVTAHGCRSAPPEGGRSGLLRRVTAAIRMDGEVLSLVAVHRIRPLPLPATEPGALVVEEGLLNLLAGVHDEGTVLDDRLADGAPLQHEQL